MFELEAADAVDDIKAGRVQVARQKIADLEKRAEGDDDLSALATLAYAAGDARRCVGLIQRMHHVDERAATLMMGAGVLLGDKKLQREARRLTRKANDDDGACIEDLLQNRDEHRAHQQMTQRPWTKTMDMRLDAHAFRAGLRRWESIAKDFPPSMLGAAKIRTKQGKLLPLWLGGPVQRLGIIFDAGYGDTFLNARHLPTIDRQVTASGGKLTVFTQNAMVDLMRFSFPGIHIVGHVDIDLLSECDSYAYEFLLSNICESYGQAAWVKVDPERASRFNLGEGLNLGLCAGSANIAAAGNALRNIPLAELAPLFQIPGIVWHSLMPDLECPANVIRHELKTWSDTCALVSRLSLTVSADTAIANMCGAMGAPVWAVLESNPDVRYGAGESTPWYPSMRCYRQRKPGRWRDPIEECRKALQKEIDLLTFAINTQ